jgi:transcription antitermination factor NusA-like protein
MPPIFECKQGDQVKCITSHVQQMREGIFYEKTHLKMNSQMQKGRTQYIKLAQCEKE